MFNNVNKAQSVSSKCGNFAANQRTFTQKALVSSKACNEMATIRLSQSCSRPEHHERQAFFDSRTNESPEQRDVHILSNVDRGLEGKKRMTCIIFRFTVNQDISHFFMVSVCFFLFKVRGTWVHPPLPPPPAKWYCPDAHDWNIVYVFTPCYGKSDSFQ